MLTIGVYRRHGRGTAVHGVLLTSDGSFMVLRDMADLLGVELRPARTSRVWRVIRWPRRRAAIREVERTMERTLAAPPSEEELLRAIFGDQIPAQRTAMPVVEHAENESGREGHPHAARCAAGAGPVAPAACDQSAPGPTVYDEPEQVAL
jgi:hypothetical protein